MDAFAAGTDPRRPKLSPRAHEPSTSTSLLGGGSATDNTKLAEDSKPGVSMADHAN